MGVFAALVAAFLWIGGWIALIASVPSASVGSALLVCGIIHGIIVFAIAFWYAALNL